MTENLTRRLRDLEDKDALRSLLIHGWRALDRKEWRTWIDCWTTDAVLEFGPWEKIRGREAVLAKVVEAESAYPTVQHHILNADFDVTGDRATGVGYMWFVAVTAPRPHGVPLLDGRSVRVGVHQDGRRLEGRRPAARRVVDRRRGHHGGVRVAGVH